MNVLLIGSGGREHALAWKLAASPLLSRIYVAPGNPGIAEEAETIELKIADHAAVEAFCKDKRIDLVVVGPEAPLVAGGVDRLTNAGVKTFGPTAAGARRESAKTFPKQASGANNNPTARFSEIRQKKAAAG